MERFYGKLIFKVHYGSMVNRNGLLLHEFTANCGSWMTPAEVFFRKYTLQVRMTIKQKTHSPEQEWVQSIFDKNSTWQPCCHVPCGI